MKDQLELAVEHLEFLVPQAKGGVCGNPNCQFYIMFLVGRALGKTEGIPAHSCLGFLGPTGPMSQDDFDAAWAKARDEYADKLKREYPQLFQDRRESVKVECARGPECQSERCPHYFPHLPKPGGCQTDMCHWLKTPCRCIECEERKPVLDLRTGNAQGEFVYLPKNLIGSDREAIKAELCRQVDILFDSQEKEKS